MGENTANIYALIKRLYPDHDVIHNANISYIKSLGETNRKIIFICKQDKTKSVSIDSFRPSTYTEKPNLDLTGSPLKDECEIDVIDISADLKIDKGTLWPEIEESYSGISMAKAQAILSDDAIQAEGAQSKSSLWILCEATDLNKTVLLEIDFDEMHNRRGMVCFRGIKPTNHLNVADLMQLHKSKIRGTAKVETTVDSFFTINSYTTLKLSSSSSNLPNINEFRNSETVLYQTVRVEDTNSVAEDFWRHLYILSIIRDDIVAFKDGEDYSRDAIYRCGRGIEMDELREKVVATMTDLSSFDSFNCGEDSCEIEAVIQRAKIKGTLDVTDKLWDILKCCSSYRDLKAGFNIVFQCAAKCNIVNLPTNDNRLAEIIREVSQRRLAIPCLTGSEPLELLLEIGLEKISKDYEYIFIESKICSINDLQINKSQSMPKEGSGDVTLNVRKSLHNAMQSNQTNAQRITLLHTNTITNSEENDIIGFQNSKFCRREIDCKMSRLAQIHLTLEHLLQIQVNLNLENVYNQISQQLLQRPLQSFDAIKNAVFDRIEIPISTESIISRLANKDPHARRIQMISRNKFKEVESTFYYNMENIFPPNSFVGIDSDEKEFCKENIYYCWEYTKFSTRRF